MINRNPALKKALIFFVFLILAGNGSYSTGNDLAKDAHIPANDFLKHLPMFVQDRAAGFVTFHIHPSLDIKRSFLRKSNLIMSRGSAEVGDLKRFLLAQNPAIPMHLANKIANYYFEESRAEGINHDIAFCQMCLETGFLAFGGVVSPQQNNFCGLGAVSKFHCGESFPNRRLGIRAHIQHLKAYASEDSLDRELIDQRFRFVKRGSAPKIDDLTGRWASDPDYSEKINNILSRLYSEIHKNKLPVYPV